MDTNNLNIYINDHRGLSTAAIALIERCIKENKDDNNKLVNYLQDLHQELDEEREILEQIIDEIGGKVDKIKATAAWVGEKLGRFKLNGNLFEYSPLSRMEELEVLRVGIHGKLGMWEIFSELKESHAALAKLNFDKLITQAEKQHNNIENFRMEAARAAFA